MWLTCKLMLKENAKYKVANFIILSRAPSPGNPVQSGYLREEEQVGKSQIC